MLNVKECIACLKREGMTLQEIADATGIRVKTLERYVKTGELPSTSAYEKLNQLVQEKKERPC